MEPNSRVNIPIHIPGRYLPLRSQDMRKHINKSIVVLFILMHSRCFSLNPDVSAILEDILRQRL